jgi:hypothetical protein
MSERDEINLRRQMSLWQSRQNMAGATTLMLVAATFGVVMFFYSNPGHQIAGAISVLLTLLMLSCYALASSAVRVVEIGERLSSHAPFQPVIIEAEVTDTYHGRR